MLAKRISVNPSTISTSLQRLKEREIFRKHYLPNFVRINRASLVAATGKFRYQFPEDIRRNIIGLVIHPAIPFFIASDNISWVVMGLVSPSIGKNQRPEDRTFSDKYVSEMIFDVNKILYDTSKIDIRRYFDYYPVLCKALNINLPPNASTPFSIWSPSELKKNEGLILQSLLNDPHLSDFKRSQILDISHPTITKIRKSLIARTIIKTVIEPNYSAIGFGIFAWFSIRLEGYDFDKKHMNMLCYYPNNILSLTSDDHMFMLFLFEDMNDVMHGQQKINEFMSGAQISYDDIIFNYFSLDNPSFTLDMNHMEAINSIVDIPVREEDILTRTPEQQLRRILRKFFSEDEASSTISELEENLGIDTTNANSTEMIISMILELLTESKYLVALRKKERTALQVQLIEKLNRLKANLDKMGYSGAATQGKRLMIVEDSKAMTNLLQEMVKEADFNVVGVVDNGQDAYKLYKDLYESNSKPDAVLMDVFIKGLSGVEATRMIKNYDPSACIVVLTSSLDGDIKKEMMSLDIDDYLIKPISNAQLINSLEQSLVKRKGLIR